MPVYPENERVVEALKALRALRHSYETGLARWKLQDGSVLRERAALYDRALASVQHADVVQLVDDALASITQEGPGTGSAEGARILGGIDLTRLAQDDLEVELSSLMGFQFDEVKVRLKLARKTLVRLRNAKTKVPVRTAGALPGLLATANAAFEKERAARLDKKRRGRDPEHKVVWNGCINAVWIIISNAEYSRQEFAKSYHFGSGLSYAYA